MAHNPTGSKHSTFSLRTRHFTLQEKLFLGLCTILLFLITLKNFGSFDMWWHLKQGEYTIAQGELMTRDIFSHTCNGCPVFNFSFLFDIYIALVKTAFGWPGLFMLPAVLVALSFIVCVRFLRQTHDGNFLLPICLTFALFVPVGYYLVFRGDMFSILLFVLFFTILRRFHTTKAVGLLPLLLATMLLWSQIHAYPIAWGMLGLSFLVWLFDFFNQRIKWKQLRFIGYAYFFISIMPWVNPFVLFSGKYTRLLPGVLQGSTDKSSYIFTHITEWKPIWEGDQRLWFIIFSVLLLIVIVSKWRRLPPFSCMCALMCVYMAHQHQRTIYYLFLISPFLLVPALTYIQSGKEFFSRTKHTVLFVFLCITALLIASPLLCVKWRKGELNIAEAVNDMNQPVNIPHVLKYNQVRGNLFNKYETGGYLLYSLYPDNFVFIDGRTNILYNELFVWSFVHGKKNPNVFTRLCTLYPFDIAVIHEDQYVSAWKEYLDKEFFFLYQDLSYLLFLRKGAFPILYKRAAFSILKPCMVNDPSKYLAVLDTAEFFHDVQVLQMVYPSGYHANLILYLHYLNKRQNHLAQDCLAKVHPYLRNRMHYYNFHITLANYHMSLSKDYARCLFHVKKAAETGFYKSKIELILGVAYNFLGYEKLAVKHFETYFSLAPDAQHELAFLAIGNYALKEQNYVKAKRYLGRYYFLNQGRVHEKVLRMLLFAAYQSRDYTLVKRIMSQEPKVSQQSPGLGAAL